jgi:RNA polymerase sigma-70 factor, ECF subfamily
MDLIHRWQAGDLDAFAELFEQYKNLVYRTAYSMLGEACEAEDALQEIFLRVHQSLRSYDASKAAFSTWLYRITINHCLNRRRAARTGAWRLDDYSADHSARHISDEERELRPALDALNEKLRTVIALRYYANLSPPEIAEVLKLPLGTVKSRLRQALESLRKSLRTDADGSPYPFEALQDSGEASS